MAFTLRVPIGVVGAITPFNFPLNLVAHKVAPAIAAGCPVVLKPAGQTPLSAIFLAELLIHDCGLPAERLSVVTGPGSVRGRRPRRPPRRRPPHLHRARPRWAGPSASRRPARRSTSSSATTAPLIIDADGDWQAAAEKVKVAGFSHAGQSCISTQRLFVHADVLGPFVEALVARVEALVVGDPMDEATDVSALISTEDTERVKAWVDDAVAEGAKLACGGDVVDGLLPADGPHRA